MSRRHRLILLLLLLALNLMLSSACSSLPPWRKSSSGDNPVMFNFGVFLGCVTLVFSYAWMICGGMLLLLTVLIVATLLLAPRK